MDSVEIVEILLIFLLSSVKFLLAPGAAIAAGFTPLQSMIISGSGGTLGITFFFYFGAYVIKVMEAKYIRMNKLKKRQIFTYRNRMLIRTKEKIGFVGLVIVTPAILSIPIGSILAAKFYRHYRITYPSLVLSTWVWAVFLSLFAETIKSWFVG